MEQKSTLTLKTISPPRWMQTISIFLRISMTLSSHPLLPQEKPAKQADTLWRSKSHGQLSQQSLNPTKSSAFFLPTTTETGEYPNNLTGRTSSQQETTLNPISGVRLRYQEQLWGRVLLCFPPIPLLPSSLQSPLPELANHPRLSLGPQMNSPTPK